MQKIDVKRDKVLSLAMHSFARENLSILLDQLCTQRKNNVKLWLEEYKELRQLDLLSELKKILNEEAELSVNFVFQHVEESWLADRLEKMPAYFCAIVLSYFSKEKKNIITHYLSPQYKVQLDSIKMTKAPARAVSQLMSQFLIDCFPKFSLSHDYSEDLFFKLPFLGYEKLTHLLRLAGLNELALALKHVNKVALKAIFYRLSVQDAQVLQKKIKSISENAVVEKTTAQLEIIALDLSECGTQDFFLAVGLSLLSKSITKELIGLAHELKFSLNKNLGLAFESLLKKHLAQGQFVGSEIKRQKILEALLEVESHSLFAQETSLFKV